MPAHRVLLDVRENEEVALVHIAGSVHIPMGEVPSRLHELDPDADIVVYCHHGMRSANVCGFLQQRDFRSVANLAGGIDAWAAGVDPSLPRYWPALRAVMRACAARRSSSSSEATAAKAPARARAARSAASVRAPLRRAISARRKRASHSPRL